MSDLGKVTILSVQRKQINVQFQIQTHKVPQITKKISENIITVLENTVPFCKAYSTAKNLQ